MSWLCPHQKKYKTVYPYGVFNEFTNIDIATRKISRQIQKHQHGRSYTHYDGCQRIKFRAKSFTQMLSDVRSSQSNFVDPEFSHENGNVGFQYNQEEIKWLRVTEIIENAVYANQHSQESLQKFKCSNKSLQNALVLMARINPKKFIELLCKPLSQQGIYEFKFFINGIVQYVVIDDYVPTYKNIPLFVGPIRQREVYPMLIEKALAKAFGCYESIPIQTQTLMQVLFCEPSRKVDLSDLKQKGQNQFFRLIQQVLDSKANALLQSRNQVKVRNYGINQNELYQLINYHNGPIENKDFNLYQIVSENKLSSWNGKFSINDQIWNRVGPSQRNQIFQDLKKNKSFCMEESDIPRIFSHILIFQNEFSINKDWENSVSKNGVPSFMQFYLKKKDKVYIRCTTKQIIRQNIIIAQRTGLQNFQFIDGFLQINKQSSGISLQLNQGHYVICVIHDWMSKQAGEYSVFLTSSQFTDLTRSNQPLVANFLQKTFIDYSNRHQQQKQDQFHAQNKMYSVFVLGQKIGFSFVHIRTHGMAQSFIKLQIDQVKLYKEKWQVIQPYADQQQIIIPKNTDIIVIAKALQPRIGHKMHFPSTAFKIKE